MRRVSIKFPFPTHCPFSIAEKSKCYEMSSFDEKQATTLLKERPLEFVKYNKHQLSRVYPAGTRFDSSNFMPQVSDGGIIDLICEDDATVARKIV